MKRGCVFLLIFLLTISQDLEGQIGPIPAFFRTQRDAPLLQLNTSQTIRVSDYGASINDGVDDTPGIIAAINAARNTATAQNPVRLLFETGTYDIMYTGTSKHAIELRDVNGFLWDGQNAEFLLHNPTVGFLALLRCENTILKDFSIDHATLPFSQGVVTNINVTEGYFDFKLDDFSPEPTTAAFMNSPQRWGMFKNAKGGIKEGTKNLIPHNRYFESIGTRTYRYGNQSANTLVNAEVGDYFVHIGRYNGSTLIRNTQGKNVTYMNIIGYASASGGFNSRDCEEWNVFDCHIKLKEGRVHTLNADAMHTNGNKIGPWVENCSFEGFSDDMMNIKYTRRGLKQVHSPTEITVLFEVQVGENLEFYNPRDGVFIGSATVTSVQALGNNLFKLTLSESVNITTINDEDNQLADKAYIESRSNESFIFRNNIVKNSRRYGILIQSKYALIEYNTFQNLSGAAIRIENGVDWGEGFRADNIEIRNNKIENCGYDQTYISESNSAAISVDFAKVKTPCTPNGGFCGTETSTYRGHSNIRIIDNTILYNRRGLYLKNIQNLTLTNNFLCHRDEDITLANNTDPVSETIYNTDPKDITNYNYSTPDANLQFLLNENSSSNPIVNTGSKQDVQLVENLNGGSINRGFYDNEIGFTIEFETEGNGYLKLVNSNDSSPFAGPIAGAARTYAFWVKPESSIFQTFLYSGGPTDGEVFAIQMTANGMVRLTDNNGNFVWMQDMLLDIGEWNHIAVTVPENNSIFSVQIYKNGIPSNETHMGSNALMNTASNIIQFFPRFKGLASDIRFFDYKLCGSEVEKIYNDRQKTLSTSNNPMANDKIKVYPTITSSLISFSEVIQSIEIYNLLGKRFLSKKGINIRELDVSELPVGMYFVKINDELTSKIIKN